MVISRWWLIVVLGLPIAGWLIWDSDIVYAYREYSHAQEHLELDFNELTSLTPAQTQAAFPVHLWCRQEKMELGDAYCASWILGWNNIHAMNSVFFYEQDKLLHAKVDVPWWYHDDLMQHIKQQYGEPDGYITRRQWGELLANVALAAVTKISLPMLKKTKDDLGVWKLKTGAWMVINMHKEAIPLQWSTVFWMSPQKVTALTEQWGTPLSQ